MRENCRLITRFMAVLVTAGLYCVGCATSDDEASPVTPAAAALAYAPPAFREATIDFRLDFDGRLARADRGPAVFLGFDSPRVSTLDLLVVDRQNVFVLGAGPRRFGYGWGLGGSFVDNYSRRAVQTSAVTRIRP
jgi:hypothetical protein